MVCDHVLFINIHVEDVDSDEIQKDIALKMQSEG